MTTDSTLDPNREDMILTASLKETGKFGGRRVAEDARFVTRPKSEYAARALPIPSI
ncbi:MAG: hypothetical protein WDN30_01690 [Pararobbsia sp.]